jgi:hypothetical protein
VAFGVRLSRGGMFHFERTITLAVTTGLPNVLSYLKYA